jgi:hypothetical protein
VTIAANNERSIINLITTYWHEPKYSNRESDVLVVFPSPTSARRMARQQSRLKRFWLRTSQPAQQQNPCDTPVAPVESGSQVVDSPRVCHSLEKAGAKESIYNSNLQKIEQWMEAFSSFMSCQLQSDSSTAQTSFRSAFEMLSFSSLCGAKEKPVPWSDADALSPSRAVDETATGFVGFAGIPREISFKEQESLNTRRDNFPEVLADLQIPDRKASFFQLLRLRGKRSRSTSSVAKLYLYVEQPKSLVRIDSIANSTITWSSEHRGHSP